MTAIIRSIVTADAVQLGARIAGNSGDPALVLLHGWPHCGALYENIMPRLAKQRYVLAFDLPAVGASHGAPPSAEKAVLADIVLRGAEALDAKSIVIAGLDVGGMIAFAAARDHASRIAGAVVMNTVVPGIAPWRKVAADPRIWHFAFHAAPDLPETLVTGRERSYFDFFIDTLAGDPKAVDESVRAAFAAAYARPEALKAGFDWYRAFEADAKRNAERREIDTPLLYMRGEAGGADAAAMEEHVRGLRDAGASQIRRKTIPGGEFSPLEAPEELSRALLEFCAQCS